MTCLEADIRYYCDTSLPHNAMHSSSHLADAVSVASNCIELHCMSLNFVNLVTHHHGMPRHSARAGPSDHVSPSSSYSYQCIPNTLHACVQIHIIYSSVTYQFRKYNNKYSIICDWACENQPCERKLHIVT